MAQRLRAAGVLGMNRRNLEYLMEVNPRGNYPRVDDKLRTKRLAEQAGIPIPPLYGVISIQRQVRELSSMMAVHTDFVIKPARGSGGKGIVVINGRSQSCYRKLSGELISEIDLRHHVSNILNGMYSLGGNNDSAFIEYRVKPDPLFADISYQGVPDIRIVVYLGVPVMAMLRLPTRRSDGKANLHRGALGAGIDIASGITRHGVRGNRPVSVHPDTGNLISGIQVPYWDELLLTAAQCYELTELGYIGADFVLDSERGPLLLELNARPGLNIQIANARGLRHRLDQVTGALKQPPSSGFGPRQRVAFARQQAAWEKLE